MKSVRYSGVQKSAEMCSWRALSRSKGTITMHMVYSEDKMNTRALGVSFFLLIYSNTAYSATFFYDGNTLYDKWLKGDYLTAQGYMSGVTDALSETAVEGYTACVPTHVKGSRTFLISSFFCVIIERNVTLGQQV